ncbi:MAG: peptidase M48 [Desulfobacca sp.]|nr:peptidase M48 [Desulfobacca sp.]
MITYNLLLSLFLAIYFFELILSLWLETVNRRHLREKGTQVPESFSGFIDEEKLARSVSYTLRNSRFGMVHQISGEIVLLIILLSGFLPFLEHLTRTWQWSFLLSGLFFILIPGLITSLIDLPFDYYHTFVIEEKFGFNKNTPKTWILDQLKGATLSLVLFSLILSLILWMIRLSPNHWWLWGFLILSVIQLLMAILYPILIAPIFNKFEPIQDQELAAKINHLMQDAGIRIKGLFQMDAGKRSRHTNAYFTGLGRTKRIVLFDTLIQSHPPEEVLAVLAHEVGHFKGKHIWKQFFLFECSMVIAFYLSYLLLDWPWLYRTFGFETNPPYVGLFLLGILGQKIGFFTTPFYMALSRRYERQADRFAVQLLKSPSTMVMVLKRLAADNLSNLFPHPLYVRFHYSHPPLMERIISIEELPEYPVAPRE